MLVSHLDQVEWYHLEVRFHVNLSPQNNDLSDADWLIFDSSSP